MFGFLGPPPVTRNTPPEPPVAELPGDSANPFRDPPVERDFDRLRNYP